MLPIYESLQIIRDAPPSNGQFLDDLKERVTATGGTQLLPLVGAGLSVPMGFPSRGAFLQELAAD